ncbi:xanthine dehydrogenase family protein molybdopterin-binding subunit [Deltaproteobacteria bacterium OttesenSCG-928-K17]|nr:xanthine dehydrogenase family protein molybdopterin-binding subunit [Deltaproteobacteria bacterium OttesenSCG-928-K17]
MSAKYLGANHIHPRIWEKARGDALFAADMAPENALVLKALRAGRYHAEIVSMDCSEAEKIPGVVRIFTSKDIPGRNKVGIINKDHPILAVGKVRSLADAVALVAAETEDIAQAALKAIKVEWKDLPAVKTPQEALLEGAPEIHEGGNLLFKRVVKRGDADDAFAKAAHVVENEYYTPCIEHGYMEPDAGYGYIDEDGALTVVVCTQNPHYDQGDMAALMDLPEEKIRIIQAVTGGGFGSKLDISVQGFICVALYHLKRPVRYCYNKEEAFLATSKRHPMWITMKTAVDADGKLLACKAKIIEDGGAYGSYGIAVATRAAVHATGPYEVPNADIEALEVYTNNLFCGAMRGFGTPQVAFAYETQLDLHAKELGLDPIEIRRRNALKPGAVTATGHKLEHSLGLPDCLDAVKPYYDQAMKEWVNEKPSAPTRRRGVGVGAMWYGVGNTAAQNPSTARLEMDLDGRITLFTGCADIGQGSSLILLQLAGEILGVHPDRFKLVSADTKFTTNAGASSASRQTYISGNAVCDAAKGLADMLLTRAVDRLKVAKDKLELVDETVRAVDDHSKCLDFAALAKSIHHLGLPLVWNGYFDPVTTPLDPEDGQGVPYGTYAFACQMAQVEVDVLTGEVDVKKIVAAHDVGRAISPINLEGQIAGGVAIGQGYALMEEFEVGSTESLKDYHMVTCTDMPEVVPILIESPEPSGPFGAKGIGEPALVPTAPAIVSAIDMAIGRRIFALPANLERVLEASRKAGWFDKL